ncbi:flagellar biosynthesis protein FlhA [bacterium]|nr:flagellar biosynthesis protein FlhA [bacterium]MCP5463122.1 flagellar biosynthesis protein FlhA [bacterium]
MAKRPHSKMIDKIASHGDLGLAIGIVGVLVAMIMPLPPFILDILLTINITIGVLVLLTTMNLEKPLEFSVFPSLLLFTTLFRLALNVATTRQILLKGFAGNVIEVFGNFVVGGNFIVGVVIFLILVVIQFAVITKGATRIAEVAARFTLDAMPGKQLSIDADLNAGLMTEDEAKERRKELNREANFYGAMDGASKFVRGDAIAGIIITFVNILGGLGIGTLQMGMHVSDALQKYTLLTIGDGLVAQIPSLIIATASGIIVTRAGDSEESLGGNIGRQLFLKPRAAIFAAVVLIIFGLVPGFPKIPFFALALIVGSIGYMARVSPVLEVEEENEENTEERDRKENLEQLLQIDPMEIEIGFSLISLVDVNQGGNLLDRITVIRKQFANDYGMIVPSIRIRDNIQLRANEYQIKIGGVHVAHGELEAESYLAMNPGTAYGELDGPKTTEPAFGLPAVWVEEGRKDYAESIGYTVVDSTSVLATHLTEIMRTHLSELLSRQDVANLIENLKQTNKAVVEDVVPALVPISTVHRVLQNLLRESVSIRNLPVIMEVLGDYGHRCKDADVLSEFVRQHLGRAIVVPYLNQKSELKVITLHPELEKMIADCVTTTEKGTSIIIEPAFMQVIVSNIEQKIEEVSKLSEHVVVICSPAIRFHLKRMIESKLPQTPVVSYGEVDPKVIIIPLGMVSLRNATAEIPSGETI